MSVLKPAVYFSSSTVPGVVCCLRQLGHVCKKRWRLPDEKTHGRKELQSTHGSVLRPGWANDRNNWEPWIQERTRFGHDQSLVEELVFHLQIRKCHRHSGHRI